MSNTLLKWAVIILVVIAAVFGYQIYMQNAPANPSMPSPASTTPVVNNNAASGNTVNVQAVLNSPSNTAPENEKKAYADLVISAAVKTNNINITSCVAEPTVSSVPDASDIVISNNDSAEHRIVFNADTFFIIPAKSSKTVKANFGKGPGIYGFGCDNSQGAIGMIFVTPK